MDQEFASSLLENAVSEFAKLPGIGRKTALRLALHLLKQDKERAHSLGEAVIKMRDEIQYCRVCHNISESHVLGGLISPIDGIGPQDIEIDSLVERVKAGGIAEVILALSATMEGDTTNFYIFRKLAPYPEVRITMLARGVSVGNEIEYTDELTLGRSIQNRTLFSDTFHKEG